MSGQKSSEENVSFKEGREASPQEADEFITVSIKYQKHIMVFLLVFRGETFPLLSCKDSGDRICGPFFHLPIQMYSDEDRAARIRYVSLDTQGEPLDTMAWNGSQYYLLL